MATIKTYLVVFSYIITLSETYKVLIAFPLMIKSHTILGDGIVKLLLEDGHEVTYIAAIPYKNDHPKLRQIDVRRDVNIIPSSLANIKSRLENSVKFDTQIPFIRIGTAISRAFLKNTDVQALMNDINEQFDVVIVEWTYNDLLSVLAAAFDSPLIWVSPLEINWAVLNLIDEPTSPAYTGDIMSDHVFPFTFKQRVKELVAQLYTHFYKYMYLDDVQRNSYMEIVAPIILKRGRNPPSFDDIRYNASFILANSHPSLGLPISVPPNYKALGGYYIDKEVAPIPEDLQPIMNNSKHGVIFFSMGSNMSGKEMPNEIRDNLIKMFATLKQTVIWKYEEIIPDLPKNVHVLKWAPQQSILSHPKCVLFITHGGLLSTTEAVHFAVPMIGIPMFLDQFSNVNRVVRRGIGKRVDLSYNMADNLKLAIEEVLNNTRYTQRVKELSFVYHDRPVPAGTELVHWVKHAVRTRGTAHLASAAGLVPFYQKLYLDLIAVIIVSFVIIYLILKAILSKASVTKVTINKKVD